MPKGIKRKVKVALSNVNREIGGNAGRGFMAAGLSAEGYAGGYRDALNDVMICLNGCHPQTRQWWDDIVKR